MRKFLTFLLMSLMTTMAWSVTVVTFIPGETVGLQPSVATDDCMSRDGVSICTTYGALAATQYRFGKNSVTTVSSQIGDIIKIVFYCTENNPITGFSEPEMAIEGNDGVWEGRDTMVQFVAGNKQVRATRIDVYIADNALLPPVIKPASGIYYDGIIWITITCNSDGAKIYYTIDGSEPTTASIPYTSPFELSRNATVKAISERDGEVSEVVSAEYHFVTPQRARCFEDLYNALDETVVQFESPIRVLAQNRNYLYVMDECGGYALIFGNVGQTYINGDVIPPGFVLAKSTWAGELEFRALSGFQPAVSNTPIQPETITADQVGHDMFAHYVAINDATITKGEDDKNYILTDAQGNQCDVYFGTMGVSAPQSFPYPCDVIGIVGSYSRDGEVFYQLLPTELYSFIPIPLLGFGTLEDIDDDVEVTMDYDATVIYQSGRYLYAKDETGYGLVYGNVQQTYRMGDVIPAGFGGVKDTYNCAAELRNPHDFLAPKDNVEVVPEEITPAMVYASLRGHYVVLRGVRLDKDRVVIMDDNGKTCPYYDRFGIVQPGNDDLDVRYNVYGIVEVYCRNGGDLAYQILPIRLEPIKPIPRICCIEDLFAFPENETVQFDCPLIVVYQSGNKLFVKDQCDQYALMYGRQTETFVNGDSIVGSVKWHLYGNNIPELIPVNDWHLVAHGPEISPVQVGSIEDVSTNMMYWYISFDKVTVTPDEDRDLYYTMSDETGDLLLYNGFDIEIPVYEYVGRPDVDNSPNISDLMRLIHYIITGEGLEISSQTGGNGAVEDSWYPCDVEGVLTIYRDQLELLPTMVKVYVGKYPSVEDYDLNNDGVINISDANVLIDIILSAI